MVDLTMNGGRLGAVASLATVLVMAVSCRPDAGIPDYSDHVGLREIDDVSDERLPGPNPYVLGDQRLFLGAFYEGGSSNEITINDVDTHYYIFEQTYSQETTGERIEGTISDLIIHAGTPWWGGGLIWDNARDLSGWTTMYISFRSGDEAFEDIDITVQTESGGVVSDLSVTASSYGYVNDGAWHSLRIPLEDFVGFSTASVRSPLILGGIAGATGEELLVDDFYYTKD